MRQFSVSSVLVVLLLPCAQAQEADVRATTDAVLELVAKDVVGRSPTTRYVSLRMGETSKEREVLAKLAATQLHELATTRGLFPYAQKDAPGIAAVVRCHEILLRFDALYFGELFVEQWEKLGAEEPFWHGVDFVETSGYKEVPYGYYRDAFGGTYSEPGVGREWVTTETKRVKTKDFQLKRALVANTTAGRGALNVIGAALGGTDTPVVDADWLLEQTMASAGRRTNYYTFNGVKDFDTYKKRVGFIDDPKLQDKQFLVELREAVARSGVATKETYRRVVHLDKPAGHLWFTLDSNQRDAGFEEKANPLLTLDGTYEGQAIEALAHKLNGFVLKGLFDKRGKLQNFAPEAIASDSTAPYQDKRVHSGLCQRCHNKGKDAGFRSFKSWVRDVYNSDNQLLVTKDFKLQKELRESYVERRLEPYLESSRRIYSDSLNTVVGWTPDEYADALSPIWEKLVERDVDLELAARRLGITAKQLQDAVTAEPLRAQLKADGKSDAEIAQAVFNVTQRMDPRVTAYRKGESLLAVDFKAAFQRFQDVVYSRVKPFKVKEVDK